MTEPSEFTKLNLPRRKVYRDNLKLVLNNRWFDLTIQEQAAVLLYASEMECALVDVYKIVGRSLGQDPDIDRQLNTIREFVEEVLFINKESEDTP